MLRLPIAVALAFAAAVAGNLVSVVDIDATEIVEASVFHDIVPLPALNASGIGLNVSLNRRCPVPVPKSTRFPLSLQRLHFALISDLDHASKDPSGRHWYAVMKTGELHLDDNGKLAVR